MYLTRPRSVAHQLILDSGWSLASLIIGLLSGLILNIIIGNALAAEGLGVYSIAISLYTSISIFSTLGINAALVKFVAEFKDDFQRVSQFVSAGIIQVAAGGIITSIGLVILTKPLAKSFGMDELITALPFVALAILFSSLNKVLLALLNGLREMYHYALYSSWRYIFLLVLTIIALWLDLGINGAVASVGLSELLLSIILYIVCRQFFSFILVDYWLTARKLFGFGIQVVVGNITATWNSQMPSLLVGWFLSKSDVGVFSVAMMFTRALLILPGAVQRVTTPAISEYDSKNAQNYLSHLISRATKYSLLLLSVMGLGLGLLIEEVVRIIYPADPSFLNVVPIFRIMVLAGVVRGVQISIAGVFTSIGKPYIAVALSGATLTILVISGVILIPISGSIGAALSITLTYFMATAIFIFLLRYIVQLKSQMASYFTIFLLLVVSYCGGLLLSNIINIYITTTIMLILFGFGLVLTRIIRKDDLSLFYLVIKRS